jgi:hypothetical protein
MNVELVSPESRQPAFPEDPGFVVGLDTVPVPKSKLLVAAFGGTMAKEGVEHPGTASLQSFGTVAGCANDSRVVPTLNNVSRAFFIVC